MAAAEDDELATHRVNPLVDHGLGLLLLLLVVHFLRHAAGTPDLLLHFAVCLLGTLAATHAIGRAADALGRSFSDARVGAHIPESCRRPLGSKVAAKKFRDQAWQLAIHVSMSLWEVRLLAANPRWWSDPTTCFDPCPATLVQGAGGEEGAAGGALPASMAELRLFYVLQLALWMWTGVSCKWLEERRKDYVEMMAHHVMTVALVLNSLLQGELAVGLVVLAVHDTSDVVLDLMKIANYLKVEGRHGFFVTEACFVLNTYVVWPYLRLYRYPVYVVRSVYFGYHRLCATNGHAGDPWANPWPDVQGWYGVYLLFTLFLLHVFWWLLMNRIAWKMVRGKAPNEAGDEEYEISMADKEQTTTLKKE